MLRVAVLVVAVDLLFFSGASNFLAAPQSRLLNQALVLGAMGLGGVALARGAIDIRSPLLLPGLGWIAAVAVATVFSQRPAVSQEALGLLLLAAPAYLVVRAVVHHPTLRPRVDWLVVTATAVFVVGYLLQALTQWLSWWSVAGPSMPPLRPGDVGLTVGTVNAVALYLELLAPIAVALAWTRWRSRVVSLGLAVLSIAALIVTGSRGAWIGAAAGAGIAALLLWHGSGRQFRRSSITPRSGAALAVAGVASVVLAPAVIARMATGDAGRVELWTAAWSMFASDPLTGVGPGAFPLLRAETPISTANLAVLTTSHNSILQVLAETGVLGLVAGSWLVVAVAAMVVRAIRQPADAPTYPTVVAVAASLVAMLVHSLVDTQFHLPAIVLLVMHLVARLDPPRGVARLGRSPARAAIAAWGAPVLLGVVLLAPVDLAMIRAQLGNNALDRGDPGTALDHFRTAAMWHELGTYRLGEAIAATRLGEADSADRALARVEATEGFTFVTASRALVVVDHGPSLERVDRGGTYDPTATVNAALLRFEQDPRAAIPRLAAAMAVVPPLAYSRRPAEMFDDQTWRAARRLAVEQIGGGDPLTAAALAVLAGEDDLADAYRARVAAGPEASALDLLFTAVRAGDPNLDAAHRLLRAAPTSAGVQNVLWMLAFHAESQRLIDDIKAVSVPMLFNTPLPPMELVAEGRVDADYSLRLPRYPMAAVGRTGPKRPYVDGMVTIEPVYRPRP